MIYLSNTMGLLKLMVEFLGSALGPNYEIVLQDAGPEKLGVIAIANGHVSGRSIGAPLTDFTLQIINQEIWKHQNFLTRYLGTTNDGRTLISSTFFIKENGTLIGTFCINYDASLYTELAEKILELGGVSIPSADMNHSFTESFFDDIDGYVDSIINQYYNENLPEKVPIPDKIELIKRFDEFGLFQLKGTINIVAEKLNCSRATVYRYISRLKENPASS